MLPLISPPTPPQLEADKASIDASFNRAFALIDQLTADTAALKALEAERTGKLGRTLDDVDSVIDDLKASNTRREMESRIIADQVHGLKELVPKALEGWKASGDAKLEELGQEVQSLKKLLENRVGRPSGGQTPTGRGFLNGNEKPRESLPTASTTNNGDSTPNTESAGGSSASASGGTAPKADSTSSSRGLERGDRKAAIPAWQMAAAGKRENVVASSAKEEKSTAEVEV